MSEIGDCYTLFFGGGRIARDIRKSIFVVFECLTQFAHIKEKMCNSHDFPHEGRSREKVLKCAREFRLPESARAFCNLFSRPPCLEEISTATQGYIEEYMYIAVYVMTTWSML